MNRKYEYPKINLAIDNCFASKRWVEPSVWAKIITDAGIHCVEISADCECDPLYGDSGYLNDWLSAVKNECTANDLRVVSLYSGHGTYSTTGLAHDDERIRTHLIEKWLVPYAHMAHELNAGIGFYIHAFSDSVLQDKDKYNCAYKSLIKTIKNAIESISKAGAKFISIEQMYSPQQIPWTISGCESFMRDTGALITIDTGHQTGQKFFQCPSNEEIYEAVRSEQNIYTGTGHSYELFKSTCEKYRCGGKIDTEVAAICNDIESHKYLFASKRDCDLYKWLAELGAYSPIIHLQQTNGNESAHRSFTAEENECGIVKPYHVLSAIKESFEREVQDGMPKRCDEITLTLELFFPLTDTASEIELKLKASADYWRKFIPKDGIRLDALI